MIVGYGETRAFMCECVYTYIMVCMCGCVVCVGDFIKPISQNLLSLGPGGACVPYPFHLLPSFSLVSPFSGLSLNLPCSP